jgi:hypothetical protein
VPATLYTEVEYEPHTHPLPDRPIQSILALQNSLPHIGFTVVSSPHRGAIVSHSLNTVSHHGKCCAAIPHIFTHIH